MSFFYQSSYRKPLVGIKRDFPSVSSDSFQGSEPLSYEEQEQLRNAKHLFQNLRKQFISQGISGKHTQIIKLKTGVNTKWRSSHSVALGDIATKKNQITYTIGYCNDLLDMAGTGWRVVGICGGGWDDIRIEVVNNIPTSE